MGKGLQKELEFSDEFYEVTGVDVGTRAEAVKAVWDYAKENELNTSKSKNGRNQAVIICDNNLASLCSKSKGTALFMGDIARLVSANIVE